MLDSIKDYTSSTLGTAIQRIKNPAFGAIAISWCAFNWKQLLYLFLSNTSVYDKIEYIIANSTWKSVIGYPIVSAIVLCGFIPWVNYLIATWQIKPLDHTDSIDNQRKAKIIRRATRLQRLQAKHDVTYEKVKTGAEKDIQSMKEQIAQSQDRMGELTAELTAKEESLKKTTSSLLEARKQNNDLNVMFKTLTSNYNELEDKYNSLKIEYDDYKSQYAMSNEYPENKKFAINGFDIHLENDNNGSKRIYLELETTSKSGLPKRASYWMAQDSRASNQEIINLLNNGLSHAKNNNKQISISEFPERQYLFFKLPSEEGLQTYQFTGARI
ncbi:TPA: hypothetical protein KE043_004245 [Citrobacter koseri]|nr:hypothetical protein [Citrobacter koseri]HBC6874409.1 hypothetical protein [Citrobacter koseri]